MIHDHVDDIHDGYDDCRNELALDAHNERNGNMVKAPVYKFKATPAARKSILLRAGICGAGGSGKTYSALAIACALADRLGIGPAYVIDSEHGSALRYAYSARSGKGFKFQHVPMPDGDYSPDAYVAAFEYVISEGAKVVLIDSISHEWDGANGCLETVDRVAAAAEARGRKVDNFSAWREVTPMHRWFLEKMLAMPAHVMFTVRAKTKYKSERDERGKMKFEKAGEGPIQREGIEYEPDLWFWMSDATLTVDKTRCDSLAPGSVHERPGADFAGLLADWIEDVEPAPANDRAAAPPPPPSGPPVPAWAAPIYAAARTGLSACVVASVEVAARGLAAGDDNAGAEVLTHMRLATEGTYPETSIGKAVVDWRKRTAARVEGLKTKRDTVASPELVGAAS